MKSDSVKLTLLKLYPVQKFINTNIAKLEKGLSKEELEELKQTIILLEESKPESHPPTPAEAEVKAKPYEVIIGSRAISQPPKPCTQQEAEDLKMDSQYWVCVDEVHSELWVNNEHIEDWRYNKGEDRKVREDAIKTLASLLLKFNQPVTCNDFPIKKEGDRKGKRKKGSESFKSLVRNIIFELRHLSGGILKNYIKSAGKSKYKIKGDFSYCIIRKPNGYAKHPSEYRSFKSFTKTPSHPLLNAVMFLYSLQFLNSNFSFFKAVIKDLSNSFVYFL